MMGSSSGSIKGGGGSSNLSPLAPPFMVDKSIARSSSTNPPMNYPELPVYGTVFDPAGPFTSVGHKFGATEPLGTTTCPSSGGVYRYPGSQPTNSDVYGGWHNAGTRYESFSYDPIPSSISDCNGDDVTKPYYSSFGSPPPPHTDTFLGANYDLLSSSGAGHFTGFGTSQVDMPGASFTGEFKPKGNGFWGGLGGGEHGKCTEYAMSSGMKDFKVSDFSSSKSHLSVSGSNQNDPFGDKTNKSFLLDDPSNKGNLFADVGNKNNQKQGAFVSQGLDSRGSGSSIFDQSFDIFGGTYHFGSLGIHQQGQNESSKILGSSSSDYSGMSRFVPVAVSMESPGLQRTLLEAVTSFSGPQKTNGFSSEDHLSQNGCYMFGCTSVTSTFPITVSNTESGGSISPAGSTLLGVPVNPTSPETACSTNHTAVKDSFYQKEPQIPLPREDMGFHPRVVIRKPPSSSKFGLSSQRGEAVNDGPDVKVVSTGTNFTSQLPHQLGSTGFNPKIDDAEASYSTEKHSSGSDLHNPAEDSPCWKGASSSRFSPFSIPDDVPAEVFVSREDRCKSPRPEELGMKNMPSVDTSDSVDIASEKMSESAFSVKPTIPNCTSGHEGSCHGNQKSYCIDLNIPDGLEFLDDSHVSAKDSIISSNQRSDLDSKLPLAAELILKEAEILSALDISEASVAAKSGNFTLKKAQKSSDRPADDINNSLSHTLGDKSNLKHNQSVKTGSESRFDVNVVMKTMMKLSQMLHCYCLGNPAALTEQHSLTLEQIVNNLSASMSEMPRQTRQTTTLPTQRRHLLKGLQFHSAEVVATTNKHATAEDILESLKDDVDALQDDYMTQAIKKILCDSLEEGTGQPELLYRSLWLEAEAALCVMKAKARFHRMKVEMENILLEDNGNLPSPKISADVPETFGLAPKGKDSPASACDHESQKSNAATKCKTSEEIPVSNSEHPLVNAMEISRAKEPGMEHIFPPFQFGSGPFMFGNDSHVESAPSVIASYQILQSHGGDSVTPNDKDGQCSNEHLQSQVTSGVDTLFSAPNDAVDVETPVMARYQILNSHGGDSGKQSLGEESYDFSSLDTSVKEGMNVQTNDVESSVMARYQILKCRMNTIDSLYEGNQSYGEENSLIGVDLSSPDNQPLNPKLFNSVSSNDGDQASIMTRLRIIQKRVSGVNSLDKEPDPAGANLPAAEDATEGWSQQKSSFMTNIFGPYPDFFKDEDVQMLSVAVAVDGEPLTASDKAKKLNTEILEGWYDNDCSSSDWEHVSKEEFRRQN